MYPYSSLRENLRSGGNGKDATDARHFCRSLRTCRQWPKKRRRDCRAANERDELAPLHVWMAPAWQEKM
jgi:hypothetical protein